jgi:hypothetical protein
MTPGDKIRNALGADQPREIDLAGVLEAESSRPAS